MSEDWKKKKIDNFVILNKVLGKGTYGTVYLGYMDDGKNQVRIAVKTVPMDVSRFGNYLVCEVISLNPKPHQKRVNNFKGCRAP
jgi:hypothetical protein